MSTFADAGKILGAHAPLRGVRVWAGFWEQISVSILKEIYIIYSIHLQL